MGGVYSDICAVVSSVLSIIVSYVKRTTIQTKQSARQKMSWQKWKKASIPCDRARTFLGRLYQENCGIPTHRLSRNERQLLSEHLVSCKHCYIYCKDMQDTVYGRVDVPEDQENN